MSDPAKIVSSLNLFFDWYAHYRTRPDSKSSAQPWLKVKGEEVLKANKSNESYSWGCRY